MQLCCILVEKLIPHTPYVLEIDTAWKQHPPPEAIGALQGWVCSCVARSLLTAANTAATKQRYWPSMMTVSFRLFHMREMAQLWCSSAHRALLISPDIGLD